MKLLNVNAALVGLVFAFVTVRVAGDGFEYNADTCALADRKDTLPFHKFHLENEMVYGPLLTTQYGDVPADCLPSDTTSIYGAWYKMVVNGIVGMEVDVKAYTWGGGDNVHSVSVMQGSCGALTCVANAPSFLELGQQHVDQDFTVTANVPYFIFYAIQNVPNAYVPHIELETADPESVCKLHRSDDLFTEGYGEGGPGVCTECSSSETTIDGASATVWTTTCTDACQQCYNVTVPPLYEWTTDGPFCYKESRVWTLTVLANGTSTESMRYCYAFADGTEICDAGPSDGACPLEVNGVACSTCAENHDQTGCAYGLEQYGVFTANCANLNDGSGEVNKCANTGFESSPAMKAYGVYTDIVNMQNTPGQAAPEVFEGTCEFGEEGPPDPSIITFAPTPAANEPVELDLNDETDKMDVGLGETVQYIIDVSDKTGVIVCDTDADSGDVDLYVAIDKSALDLNFLDCYSERYDSEEHCEVVVEGNSQVYANVFGYTNATGVTIECHDKSLDDAHTMKVGVGKHSSTFDLPENGIRFYKLDAPTDSARIICTTTSDDGDLDLFMRIGTLPVPFVETQYDCASIDDGGNENCEIDDGPNTPIADGPDIYILMLGYTNVSGAELECEEVLSNATTLTTGNAENLDRGKTKSRYDLLENEKRAFYIDVPSNSVKVWCTSVTHSDVGKAELYTNVGDLPVLPGDGDAPETQCSNGVSGNDAYCEYTWDGNDGSPGTTKFYAVSIAQNNEPTIGVDMNCNAIVEFKQSDAKKITRKETFNLVQEQDIGFYWDVQQHTGEIKCTTRARNGNIDIYMSRQWPSKNGGNDCQQTGGGSDEECSFTYGNDGSNREKMYILVHAASAVDAGELRCSAKPSENYKQSLVNQAGDALQNFLDQFNTGY